MATTGQVLTTTDRVLQPLEAPCRPATLPSWGHRWGAAGPLPSPRAGRQTGGYHLVDGPVRLPDTQEGVIEGRSKLQCCNRPGPPAGQWRHRNGITGGPRFHPV